jgi:cytochrome c
MIGRPAPRWAAVCLAVAWAASPGWAESPRDIAQPAPQGPASLFANHCGICHSVEHSGAPRQGPNLAGVFLRKAGTLTGFRYSPGFAQADFVWDDDHLDAWLADPQQLIPGALMRYRQTDPAIRGRIIAWLKQQH